MGYLIDNKRQSATVKSYISAVKAILMEIGVKLDNEHTQFSSLTKACHLVNDQIKTRLPIQKDLLSTILKQIDEYYGNKHQNYLRILYKALISTAYFGLF